MKGHTAHQIRPRKGKTRKEAGHHTHQNRLSAKLCSLWWGGENEFKVVSGEEKAVGFDTVPATSHRSLHPGPTPIALLCIPNLSSGPRNSTATMTAKAYTVKLLGVAGRVGQAARACCVTGGAQEGQIECRQQEGQTMRQLAALTQS